MHQLYHEYALNVPLVLDNSILEFELSFPVSTPDKVGYFHPSPDSGIRTHDLLIPNQARYQTALHPDNFS